MSTFHSTMNRRDFMKIIGLAGAGCGAAAVAGQPFSDLDELTASPQGLVKKPWYVKETDNPTVEIDWAMMKRYDWNELYTVYAKNRPANVAKAKEWAAANKPGYSLRDRSLHSATGFAGQVWGTTMSFVPRTRANIPNFWPSIVYGLMTPEQLGVPRWQGTPEENLKMLRSAARFWGAKDLTAVPLDSRTKNLVNGIDRDKKPVIFEDVELGYETTAKRVVPNRMKHLVTWSTLQSTDMIKRAPDAICASTIAMGYDHGILLCNRLQHFITGLGYEALSPANYNYLALCGPTSILSGQAEAARMGFPTLDPELGPMVRRWMLITDLPIAETKPIDAGMFRFCRTCAICAENCPGSAINLGEPTWDVLGNFNHAGSKSYPFLPQNCRDFWMENTGIDCSVCLASCPFSTKDKADIHHLIKFTIANSDTFNSFFKGMSKSFKLDRLEREKENSWWDLPNQPVFGFDTTRTTSLE